MPMPDADDDDDNDDCLQISPSVRQENWRWQRTVIWRWVSESILLYGHLHELLIASDSEVRLNEECLTFACSTAILVVSRHS